MTRRAAIGLPLLALLVPLAFLIALRLFTEDEIEGVTFDRQPVVSGVTEREVRL